jgi:hypothetical protein
MSTDPTPAELILTEQLSLVQAEIVRLLADNHHLKAANMALSLRVDAFERASTAPPSIETETK